MSLEEMNKIEDVVLLFDQLFIQDEADAIGEKDFIRFVKRVNRDMTSEERFIILKLIMSIVSEKRGKLMYIKREEISNDKR